MNRQRQIVVAVLSVVVGFGALYFGYQRFYVAPLDQLKKDLAKAEDAAETSLDKLTDFRIDEASLAEITPLILGGPINLAKDRYQPYLVDLFRSADIPAPSISQGTAKKQGSLHVIAFNVDFETDIWSLTKVLHAFYSTPQLQQITNLSLTAVDRRDIGPGLKASLTIEVVALDEAEGTIRKPGDPAVRPTADFKPFVDPNRDTYGIVVEKNILFASGPEASVKGGNPDLVVLTFVLMVKGQQPEATLFDQAENSTQRVAVGEEMTIGRVRALVLDIGFRDMVVEVDGNMFLWGVGKSFGDCLRAPLSAEEALDRQVRSRLQRQSMD